MKNIMFILRQECESVRGGEVGGSGLNSGIYEQGGQEKTKYPTMSDKMSDKMSVNVRQNIRQCPTKCPSMSDKISDNV